MKKESFFVKDGRVKWIWQLLAVVPLFMFGDAVVFPVQLLFQAIGMYPAETGDVAQGATAAGMIITFVIAIVATGFAIRLAQRFVLRRRPERTGLMLNFVAIFQFAGGLMLGAFLAWAAWFTVVMVGLTDTPVGGWTVQPQGVLMAGVVITLVNFIQTGFLEEGVFRCYLPQVIGQKMPVWLTLGVSSLAFSLLHIFSSTTDSTTAMQKFLYFTFVTLFGFAMAIIFHSTNSLWLVIGLHATYDAFESYLGLGVTPDKAVFLSTPTTSDSAGYVMLMMVTAIALGLAGAFYLINRTRFAANLAGFYGRADAVPAAPAQAYAGV